VGRIRVHVVAPCFGFSFPKKLSGTTGSITKPSSASDYRVGCDVHFKSGVAHKRTISRDGFSGGFYYEQRFLARVLFGKNQRWQGSAGLFPALSKSLICPCLMLVFSGSKGYPFPSCAAGDSLQNQKVINSFELLPVTNSCSR